MNNDWEPTDEKGQLYTLIFATLYRELEHPQILVPAGCLELNPHRYQGNEGQLNFWESQKLCLDFSTAWVWAPLTSVLSKGQAHFEH